MTDYLLDTNVLSELRRARPKPRVIDFVATQTLERLHVSVVTFAEIRFGVELMDNAARRAEIRTWLDLELRPMFEDRVLPITEDVMLTWRLMVEEGRKAGHTFGQPDLLIAATAATHGLTVATRDVGDFALAHVPVFNPWKNDAP